jgi:hypothetical protein
MLPEPPIETERTVLEASRALRTELHEGVLAMRLQREELRHRSGELKMTRESLSRTSSSISGDS